MCAAAERYIDSYLAALGDKISDREMAAGLRGFMKADVVFHAGEVGSGARRGVVCVACVGGSAMGVSPAAIRH